MKKEGNLREIQEARMAGERALTSLGNVKSLLHSARNWGLWDLFGGGFISGMMKHSKIKDANNEMEQARYQLQLFQKELKDIEVPSDFQMDVGGFLIFADFFFDGLIADWLVQSKIAEAKEQVEDAIIRVNTILNDLNRWETQLLLEDER